MSIHVYHHGPPGPVESIVGLAIIGGVIYLIITVLKLIWPVLLVVGLVGAGLWLCGKLGVFS